jgi:hypothetical protein
LPTPLQTGIPVVQDVAPVWHMLPPGLHGVPSVHGLHCEFLQVEPGAQAIQEGPHARVSLVVSAHAFPQSVCPLVQAKAQVVPEQTAVALGGVELHAAHKPPQQMPDEQPVPSATSPVSTHVACPVEHDVVPVWQALPLGLQGEPAEHMTHAPEKQTAFSAQGVPFGALPQTSASGVQVALGAHDTSETSELSVTSATSEPPSAVSLSAIRATSNCDASASCEGDNRAVWPPQCAASTDRVIAKPPATDACDRCVIWPLLHPERSSYYSVPTI